MSTLIVYMTRHGCAAKAAAMLEARLEGEVKVADLKKDKKISPGPYSTVIVGGSIHAGMVQRKIKKFCRDNMDLLLARRLGLFLCCMEEGEKARKQFEDAFPPELRSHAIATGLFGGEFDFSKMNFLEKKIIRNVAEITENVSKINDRAIEDFASQLVG